MPSAVARVTRLAAAMRNSAGIALHSGPEYALIVAVTYWYAAGYRKDGAVTMRSELYVNAQCRRDPWGYLGMTVHIYRPVVKGPARMKRLYAMRSLKGVIATARTMDALADLARREQWVARYRHVDADGREVWVTVPA